MFVFDGVEALGLVAGVFGTFAAAPQAVKIIRSRSAEDVSLTMFAMAITGATLWGLYGWLKALPAIVFWNAIAFAQLGLIIVLKLYFDHRQRRGE